MKPAKPTTTRPSQQETAPPYRARLPLAIPIEPYMRDHRFDGRIIVPAVEIMQRLAVSLQSHFPGTPVSCMRGAAFGRFLQAGDESGVIDAWHELELKEDGTAHSRLETSGAVGGGNVRRTKVHAVLEFAPACGGPGGIPLDIAAALDGIAFAVPAEKVYAELVPFGPSYQNIVGSVSLTRGGASGLVRGPQSPAPAAPLGSPFPLDAAMHAACAWGQRFRGYVAFPVGFAQREVLRPTRPAEDYYCRVLPDVSAPAAKNSFLTDILIYTLGGTLCERLRGVIMKDVSGGRTSPPAWVKAGATNDMLGNISGGCLGLSVIDMEGVAAFADGALSPAERQRYGAMGERRRRTYLAGRLALKRLARRISGDCSTPASALHTVMADGVRPRLPVPGETRCSLSHDSRYAFAAADHEAVGVDVERVSARAMKARHIYMSQEEQDLAEQSGLGSLAASVRVWSIKEGLSKAVGLPLAECWKETGVYQIGSGRSLLKYRGNEYIALHDQFEDHLFTLVKRGVRKK